MIQICADGALVYDSRLREPGKDYSLLSLKTTTGLNKGGTAEIGLPPGHPMYSKLISHRTVVEIFRDGVSKFRGRPLCHTDNVYNQRTWTCEGELCFLQDGLDRPYVHQGTPEEIFRATIDTYNDQVDEFKRFRVGSVTVTDPNDYIRIESEAAVSSLDTVNKLLSACGGYITFSTAEDGVREIHWLASVGRRCTQAIRLGSNLLDFSRSGENTDLATVLVPYGAKDATTGARITIESVNDGLDYIEDADAVALRGRIVKTQTWDDVTEPANLLTKAKQSLREKKLIITSLQLTAIDLATCGAVQKFNSYQQVVDSYSPGDLVLVQSPPHAVNDDFQLTDKTEDWLNPGSSTVTLGKTVTTLTGSTVAGDKKGQSLLNQARQEIKADYQRDIANAMTSAEVTTRSLIEQASNEIRLEVSRQETDITGLQQQISTMEQTAEDLSIEIQDIRDNGVSEVKTTTGYHFSKDGLQIGKSGEQIENLLDHTGMKVSRSGEVMLKADADGVIATDVSVRNYLVVGNHARFEDYTNGEDDGRTACFYM